MGSVFHNMWAIGGGKGGVGVSFVASHLSRALALSGYDVVLVDADLTGANIHTLFGIKYPEKTLGDYLLRRVKEFGDLLLPTKVPNLHLICGASNVLEIANPKFAQKQKLIRGILDLEADYVILDTGTGWSFNNLDFFNLPERSIIVTNPSLPAIQSGYVFLRMAIHRKILNLFQAGSQKREKVSAALRRSGKTKHIADVLALVKEIDSDAFQSITEVLYENWCHLVVNKATGREAEKVSKAMTAAAHQFLKVSLPYLGRIACDRKIADSMGQMKPHALSDNVVMADSIMMIAEKMSAGGPLPQRKRAQAEKKRRGKGLPGKVESRTRFQLVLNDDVTFEGARLHVQTEDLGIDKSRILTVVFHGGRVLFSRTTDHGNRGKEDDDKDAVIDKVKWQHKTVIAGIKKGKLKDKIKI